MTESQSQPSGEASADAEVFAGLDAELSAPRASDAQFWKAEWHKLDAIRDDLLEAGKDVLSAKREIDDYLKIGMPARSLLTPPDRTRADKAFAALTFAVNKATGLPAQPPIDSQKRECKRTRCAWPECACGDSNSGVSR